MTDRRRSLNRPRLALKANRLAGSDLAGVEPGGADGARTPPDRTPLPKKETNGEFDLMAPECYLNRELTWLNFNFRVLHEARDPRTPLLERMKFLAIVGSNLDEFFMKRIGGLKQQRAAGISFTTVDGRTPRGQIADSYEIVRELEALQQKTFEEVRGLLEGRGRISWQLR